MRQNSTTAISDFDIFPEEKPTDRRLWGEGRGGECRFAAADPQFF